MSFVSKSIGNTPTVLLQAVKTNRIYAKCEFANPSGSIKDRAVPYMLTMMQKRGMLTDKKTVVEATSGNTGISLAHYAKNFGLSVRLFVQESQQSRAISLIKQGVSVEFTPSDLGIWGAILRAEAFAESNPEAICLRQFSNPDAIAAYQGICNEVLRSIPAPIDYLFAGVGTSATFTAIADGLKRASKGVRAFAVEPEACAVLQGKNCGPHAIHGIGAGFVPPLFCQSLCDGVISVNEDESTFWQKKLRAEGLAVGISSGAVLAAAQKMLEQNKIRQKTVLIVLPDVHRG